MKKVLLINPLTVKGKGVNEVTLYSPLGLAYLASYLREKACSDFYEIKIFDANIMRVENKNVLEKVREISPDIVGIHLNVALAWNGIKLTKLIKKEFPNILTCIGGPIVSSNPKKTLNASDADIAIIGEGEISFLEICESKNLKEIKGIAYKKNNKVIFNEPRPLIKDIDDIPFPAYDLLPDFKIYKSPARKTPVGPIITSRGCPYNCTFCSSSVFGKKFRAHSPRYVIKMIDMLVNEFGVKQIDVWDDNFTQDIKRAEKIFDLINRRKYDLSINLENGVRADRLTENLIKKMKKAGVFKVGIGLESADKKVLKKIKKSLKPQDFVKVIKLFKKYGILTSGFFMFGLPFDTKKSINKSIDFAVSANPTMANFAFFIPFPGTEIYDYMKKEGLLKSNNELGPFEKRYHKHLFITEEELIFLQRKAYLKFYLRPSKIFDVLKNIKNLDELKWFLEALAFIIKNIFYPEQFNS